MLGTPVHPANAPTLIAVALPTTPLIPLSSAHAVQKLEAAMAKFSQAEQTARDSARPNSYNVLHMGNAAASAVEMEAALTQAVTANFPHMGDAAASAALTQAVTAAKSAKQQFSEFVQIHNIRVIVPDNASVTDAAPSATVPMNVELS